MADIVKRLKETVVAFGGAASVSDVSGDTIADVMKEVNTAIENGGGGGGGGGAEDYEVTFSQNASEQWEADKTVDDIVAAYNADKTVKCTIILSAGTYVLGTLAIASIRENAVVFSATANVDGVFYLVTFHGSVDAGGDIWQVDMFPSSAVAVPEYDPEADIGKMLMIGSDGLYWGNA